MNTSDRTYKINELQDLIAALSGQNTTIADYLVLCERLWQDPRHRPWLIVAMVRKAAAITNDPDKACIGFLANKISDTLIDVDVDRRRIHNHLIQFLPEIIQLMSKDVWAEPWALWRSLLNDVSEEFGLAVSHVASEEQVAVDPTIRKLALFFADAIDSEWNDALEKRLKSWQGHPEYDWLIGLRRAAKLDMLLGKVCHDISVPDPLHDLNLLQKLRQMKPYDRRRVLVLYDATKDKHSYSDPTINEVSLVVQWRFEILFGESADLQLLFHQGEIGRLLLIRGSNGSLTMAKITGVFDSLKENQHILLVPARAAAVSLPEYVILTNTLQGYLEPTSEGVELHFKWSVPEVSNHD